MNKIVIELDNLNEWEFKYKDKIYKLNMDEILRLMEIDKEKTKTNQIEEIIDYLNEWFSRKTQYYNYQTDCEQLKEKRSGYIISNTARITLMKKLRKEFGDEKKN